MPRHDFRCEVCDNEVEVFLPHTVGASTYSKWCSVCGNKLKWVIPLFKAHTFEPYVEYNLGKKPILIESKNQLRVEAKKRGLSPASLA